MLFNFLKRRGFLRRYILPKTMYGRFIALIIIPVVMVQAIGLWVFYDRHWQENTENLSKSIIGEMSTVIIAYKNDPESAKVLAENLYLTVEYSPTPIAKNIALSNDPTGVIFVETFQKRIKKYTPIIRFVEPREVKVLVGDKTQFYTFTFNEYRLYSTVTAKLVWMWTLFIGLFFVVGAIGIARNQAKPIKLLSKNLIAFSRGEHSVIDNMDIRGSNEVRTAIYNFKIMAMRIIRQRQQRTDMLSGISHDLRTPLTRMKLLLAMMPKDNNNQNISDNILDMERMIDAYLSFAKDDKNQKPQVVHIHAELKTITKKWQASGHNVILRNVEKISPKLRLVSIQRMFENIIANAVKYADKIEIDIQRINNDVVISIWDNGCGISADKIQDVFKPFVRVDDSRNAKTGGVGLGLTVSLDIATAHGGAITLYNRQDLDPSDVSGLKVEIILPIYMDA